MITKGYGITVKDIDESCPADLKPYEKARCMEENILDVKNWQLGQYFGAVIATAFSKKSKYPEKPLFQTKDGEYNENRNKESQEEVAMFEMQQRINALRAQGLPESPI